MSVNDSAANGGRSAFHAIGAQSTDRDCVSTDAAALHGPPRQPTRYEFPSQKSQRQQQHASSEYSPHEQTSLLRSGHASAAATSAACAEATPSSARSLFATLQRPPPITSSSSDHSHSFHAPTGALPS